MAKTRAAIYTRIAPGESSDEQVKKCQAYIYEEDYTLDEDRHIYREVGADTGLPKTHPAFAQVYAAAGRSEFTKVIVTSFDRVSKNPDFVTQMFRELRSKGVEMISLEEN